MSDLISRQAAKDAIAEKVFHDLTDEFYGVMQVLDELPSTDRTGHWVGVCEYCHHLTEVTGELYLPSGFRNHNICDQCWQSALEKSKYCPNCGADMRGVDDESTL